MTGPLAMPARCRSIALAVLIGLSGLFAPISPPAAATSAVESADRTSYVLLAAGGQSSTMSGSTEDLRRAKALRVGKEALLYVRQGGAAYVIRDAATLARAEAIFGPQQALGARQGQLGSRQAALGAQQARLGAEQARLGAQQAGATPRRAQELGRQQNALGQQQNALGQQQNALGRQQAALGREQQRLAHEAKAKFRDLLAEALKRGIARRVN